MKAASSQHTIPTRSWDIFCTVVDNYGDIGVCWRLARDLASRGQQVRLWVDDPQALRWMAPQGTAPVEVIHWREDSPTPAPGEVVVETFGCDPPPSFVAGMAALGRPPVWLNLEYLSAESYVERSHRLASPQFSGPGAGMQKWFFYPGFTPATGGLLREPGLIEQLDALAPDALLGSLGLRRQPGERLVSVFCYPGAPLQTLIQHLAGEPTLLLATPGAAAEGLSRLEMPPQVRLQTLPWLSQDGYDHLLRACTLNLVRGEDSFVRAQWAGQPFLWHIYPQADGVHSGKLAAFLDRHLQSAPATLAGGVRAWMQAWNSLPGDLPDRLPAITEWQAQATRWRAHLLAQPDLVSQLLDFVAEKR